MTILSRFVGRIVPFWRLDKKIKKFKVECSFRTCSGFWVDFKGWLSIRKQDIVVSHVLKVREVTWLDGTCVAWLAHSQARRGAHQGHSVSHTCA